MARLNQTSLFIAQSYVPIMTRRRFTDYTCNSGIGKTKDVFTFSLKEVGLNY